jgi:hypothetical protein
LTQYHILIEITLEKPIQKKALYRRFESSNMIEGTGETISCAAMFYRLKEAIELVNFE